MTERIRQAYEAANTTAKLLAEELNARPSKPKLRVPVVDNMPHYGEPTRDTAASLGFESCGMMTTHMLIGPDDRVDPNEIRARIESNATHEKHAAASAADWLYVSYEGPALADLLAGTDMPFVLEQYQTMFRAVSWATKAKPFVHRVEQVADDANRRDVQKAILRVNGEATMMHTFGFGNESKFEQQMRTNLTRLQWSIEDDILPQFVQLPPLTRDDQQPIGIENTRRIIADSLAAGCHGFGLYYPSSWEVNPVWLTEWMRAIAESLST